MINKFQGETRWLSNFHVADIEYEGLTYPSTEAAYQAAKSLDPEVRKAFTNRANTPGWAKKAGSSLTIRDDWESVKIDVMYEVCRYKFFHHEELKQKLLATGDIHLEEGNSWGDTFWGTTNGKGKNHLGIILMKIREELRNETRV
jgi:ribA/ribD-fused uncharacterized protein